MDRIDENGRDIPVRYRRIETDRLAEWNADLEQIWERVKMIAPKAEALLRSLQKVMDDICDAADGRK